MRPIILAVLITCLAVGTAAAQSCHSQAVSAEGRPLHGAAKMSYPVPGRIEDQQCRAGCGDD